MRRATLIALLVLLATCFALAQTNSARPAIDPAKVIDLTYSFGSDTIYWPTAKPFEWQKESWGVNAQGWFYAAGRYAASEHGGTHLDSPVHFSEGKNTVDQIPVSHLVAPAVVIDVTAQAAKNADYLVTPADLTSWEKQHGQIPSGAIACVRTGWGKFWPDKKRYMGTDLSGTEGVAALHFPGVSPEAAKLLVERKVAALAIDTASMDYGQSKDFMTHRILTRENIFGLENVANMDKLPTTGATIIALPMKIAGGSGAPTRIIAILP